METQKKEEKNIVLEMKRLLGRMMVQVDYMYRNDREISRLDYDVLMERTRDFYDLLCDYQLFSDDEKMNDAAESNVEINEGGEVRNRDVEFEIETPACVGGREEDGDDDDDNDGDDDNDDDNDDDDDDDDDGDDDNDDDDDDDDDNDDDGDDDDDGVDDWEDEEDVTFHIEPVDDDVPVSLVDDNSLAARLHRTRVSDIRTALGINDKIMIINDLFKGSAERYNKSVAALNEFTTLRGARIYMSELQIELQWDVESQAYQILSDLVERRFI